MQDLLLARLLAGETIRGEAFAREQGVTRAAVWKQVAALRAAGHPCRLVYFTKNRALTHAFPALKPELPESRSVMDQLVEWIGAFTGE